MTEIDLEFIACSVNRCVLHACHDGPCEYDVTAEHVPAQKPRRPKTYKVICISMYTQDLEQLEAKVAELKRRGWRKASKSQLIRFALARLDVDEVHTR